MARHPRSAAEIGGSDHLCVRRGTAVLATLTREGFDFALRSLIIRSGKGGKYLAVMPLQSLNVELHAQLAYARLIWSADADTVQPKLLPALKSLRGKG